MKAIEVTDIEKATHWMPTKDINSSLANVTENRLYKFLLNDEDELIIIDDKGIESLAYLAINGKLFKF